MDPALILFGIQAVVRLGKVAKNASEEYARDAEALFPDIKTPKLKVKTFINGFFGSANYRSLVSGDNAPFKNYWGPQGVKDAPESLDAMFTAILKIQSSEGGNLNRWLNDSTETAGITLIKQWDPDNAPMSPLSKVILAAGDIALEYISINPGILGVGGNGEKLIGAYAGNISVLLPNSGDFGKKDKFTERIIGVFLRAGLDTLNKNPEWVVSEKHVQALISSMSDPIIKAFPESGNVTEQINFEKITDAITGPAASAAMQVIAENSESFLGKNFNSETAAGSLTKALLKQAAKTDPEDRFEMEGLLGLYKAGLNVAATQPELFYERDGRARDKVALDLITNFANVLKDSKPPFDGNVGVQLAGAALGAVSKNAHHFANPDKPWDEVAAKVVTKLTGDLAGAFAANEDIEKLFTTSQLIEVGRIILEQISINPGLVISHEDAAAQIIKTVATSMANDKYLLLNGDDWIEIVKVASKEASANPGRLFNLDPTDPYSTMAARLISLLLSLAGDVLEEEDSKGKTVLFGQTLREAITIILKATSGNPAAAKENLSKIEALIKDLNKLITEDSDRFGNKEWLYLFRVLLETILSGKEIENLDISKAENILAGRQ